MEIFAMVLSCVSAAVSLFALWFTVRQSKLSQGQMELSIHDLIARTKKDMIDL